MWQRAEPGLTAKSPCHSENHGGARQWWVRAGMGMKCSEANIDRPKSAASTQNACCD